jgi:hypothetical protein
MGRYSTETGKVASGKHEWPLVWILLDKDFMGDQVLSIGQPSISNCSARLTRSHTCYVRYSAGHHRLASHPATWSSSQACLHRYEFHMEVR